MYINDIRLVGQLVEDVSIQTVYRNNSVITAKVLTARPIKDKTTGKTKWLSQTHEVVCYRNDLVFIMRQYGKKGAFVKVMGELVYNNRGQPQIVVRSGFGDFGMMNSVSMPQAQEPDPNENKESHTSESSSQNKPTRTFGSNNSSNEEHPSQSEVSESRQGNGSSFLNDVEDEIPF